MIAYPFLRNFILLGHLIIFSIGFITYPAESFAQQGKPMQVGVARIDITPQEPIRLAGFALRTKAESAGVLQRLNAKALVFGADNQKPSILITVDLIGIPDHVTKSVAKRLFAKAGIGPERIAICASHTHSGPEVGTLLNILQYRSSTVFTDSLIPADQMTRIALYVTQLTSKLEQVALEALQARRPALISWGQGSVNFAENRRRRKEIVDHSMPLLKVANLDGSLRAVLVNYACHAVTLGHEVNQIHGDWVGEVQEIIEKRHPEAVAMVAVGCGADANPSKNGTERMDNFARANFYGRMIADEADRLLSTPLKALQDVPVGRLNHINLKFASVPSLVQLVEQSKDRTIKGYYARLAMERLARGETISPHISYPVQTWQFGKDLAMVFLGGEVVADYSLRLKKELGSERLWINAYSNDVPCYIGSKRVIKEGGYEGETSMYYYDKPSRLDEEAEDLIVSEVHRLLQNKRKTKQNDNLKSKK